MTIAGCSCKDQATLGKIPYEIVKVEEVKEVYPNSIEMIRPNTFSISAPDLNLLRRTMTELRVNAVDHKYNELTLKEVVEFYEKQVDISNEKR